MEEDNTKWRKAGGGSSGLSARGQRARSYTQPGLQYGNGMNGYPGLYGELHYMTFGAVTIPRVAGVGAEFQYGGLRLATSYYVPLSGWKGSKNFNSRFVQERPAEGWDASTKAHLPFYRNVALAEDPVAEKNFFALAGDAIADFFSVSTAHAADFTQTYVTDSQGQFVVKVKSSWAGSAPAHAGAEPENHTMRLLMLNDLHMTATQAYNAMEKTPETCVLLPGRHCTGSGSILCANHTFPPRKTLCPSVKNMLPHLRPEWRWRIFLGKRSLPN